MNGISVNFNGLNDAKNILNRSGNNIANINTKGFKAVDSLTGSVNYSVSTFLFTGNKLDLGIEGEGFFKLTDDKGGVYYSRKGDFSLDLEGNIVDSKGYKLEPNIKLNANMPFAINKDGSIYQDGKLAGKIDVYDFKGKQGLIKKSGGYVTSVEEPVKSETSDITSGIRESSNTDISKEMVAQIFGSAFYEANIKSMKVFDEILGEALDLKA